MSQITIKKTSFHANEIAEFLAFPSQAKKAADIVSGLIGKEISRRQKKLDETSFVEVSLDSLLSGLLVSASGAMTRKDVSEFLESQKESLLVIFLASKGKSIDEFSAMPVEKQTVVLSMLAAICDRVAVSITANSTNLVGAVSASLEDLILVSSLPEIPENLKAKIDQAISAQDIF